jgi:hypothetical protein
MEQDRDDRRLATVLTTEGNLHFDTVTAIGGEEIGANEQENDLRGAVSSCPPADTHLRSVIQLARDFVLAAELASAAVHLASLNATWYE